MKYIDIETSLFIYHYHLSDVWNNISYWLIDQYGNYKVEEVDVYLNGINTQGENIADNGGIKQAFYVGR